MKYSVVHNISGRVRLRCNRYAFNRAEALAMTSIIKAFSGVLDVNVSSATGSILIYYQDGCLHNILHKVSLVSKDDLENIETHFEFNYQSEDYILRLSKKILFRYFIRPLVPSPIGRAILLFNAARFIKKGIENLLVKRKINVEVLDAAAITASLVQKSYGTAGSIMFLLSLSELMEEWTQNKSRANLASCLALNIDNVWVEKDGEVLLTHSSNLKQGDAVIVRVGSAIPVDGSVIKGEAMVNQASMTGEPLPIKRGIGSTVYAGSVVEEGSITIEATALNSETRINRIISLIDESENHKSSQIGKSERLADAIVPFSFIGAAVAYLFTRSFTRMASILLVDYSCAIKLSTSLTILSGLHEAAKNKTVVKGGKFLEAFAEADTIIFDKTGTLTNACPQVKNIIPFGDYSREEILEIAACLEEHFPHSVARSIVQKAIDEGIEHSERHTEVDYVIAHGIASKIDGKRVLIGSEHFIFEDENTLKTVELVNFINENSNDESILYLAIDGLLAGIILVEDPVRETAFDTISALKKQGFKHIVMLTGDSEKNAKSIANALGIDEYKAQMLPEDKAKYIQDLKTNGHIVIMVGDGVNDTPALSSANVGVSMKSGSDIAREVADVSLLNPDLDELVKLRVISVNLMKKLKNNYRFVVIFNTLLIGLGFNQVITPGQSAFAHNISTIGLGVNSLKKLS